MKIEAVTVCIDYSDCLSRCIQNKDYVDEWIIVTHHRDDRTIQLCIDNDIRYIESERIYNNGAYFAKGKAINEGLLRLAKDDWILHIDADQKLPSNFRDIISTQDMDKECIYGAARQYDGKLRVEINPSTGEVHQRPLVGFFQLWHSSKFTDYPENSKHAGDDDQDMPLRFNYPEQWKYLDLVLEDTSGEFCMNWYGRKFHKRLSAIRNG